MVGNEGGAKPTCVPQKGAYGVVCILQEKGWAAGPSMRGHVPRYLAFPVGTLSAKNVPFAWLERPGQDLNLRSLPGSGFRDRRDTGLRDLGSSEDLIRTPF